MEGDPSRRQYAPATERNRVPILEVLRRVLPARGTVLEVASGTGEHAVWFGQQLPDVIWQPTDLDDGSLASIAAWIAHTGVTNVRPPIRLDATAAPWAVDPVEAVFSANMIHIAPEAACLGLMRGTAAALVDGGVLILYGPFHIGGHPTAPSNEAFDADLRRRNPSWGIRHLEWVEEVAKLEGLHLEDRIPMPANNQTLLFRRSPRGR